MCCDQSQCCIPWKGGVGWGGVGSATRGGGGLCHSRSGNKSFLLTILVKSPMLPSKSRTYGISGINGFVVLYYLTWITSGVNGSFPAPSKPRRPVLGLGQPSYWLWVLLLRRSAKNAATYLHALSILTPGGISAENKTLQSRSDVWKALSFTIVMKTGSIKIALNTPEWIR